MTTLTHVDLPWTNVISKSSPKVYPVFSMEKYCPLGSTLEICGTFFFFNNYGDWVFQHLASEDQEHTGQFCSTFQSPPKQLHR